MPVMISESYVQSNVGFYRQGILFGLGNPLLDISAEVTPEFLQR